MPPAPPDTRARGTPGRRSRSFLDPHPYRFLVYSDSQTREVVYYLDSAADPPITLSPIIGDVLTNLHSALDFLAWQFYERSKKTMRAEDVYFPIFHSPNHYKAAFPRKVEGFWQSDIDFISAIKPYKGGNDALWFIKHLNNTNKHRLLLTTSSIYVSYDSGLSMQRRIERETGIKFTQRIDVEIP